MRMLLMEEGGRFRIELREGLKLQRVVCNCPSSRPCDSRVMGGGDEDEGKLQRIVLTIVPAHKQRNAEKGDGWRRSKVFGRR
jgi:hypothetical protein